MQDTIYADGQYLRNNPTWHDHESRWKAGHVLRMLARHNLTPHRVCDVGCGAGGIIQEMSLGLPGTSLVGYEMSPQAFEMCRLKESQNLSFVHGAPPEGPLDFDLAMALDVLEHVEDYMGFLRQMKAKGELKLFHVPLEVNAVASLSRSALLRAWEAVGHLHFFTRETLLAALHRTGYEVLDCFYTNHPLDTQTSSWRRLGALHREVIYRTLPEWGARLFGDYNMLVLAK